MNKILSLLDKKQKNIALLIAALIFFLSIFELLIFNLIQPIIIFFSRDDGVDQIKSIGGKFNLNITALQILIFFFAIFVIRSLLSVVISYLRQKLIKDITSYSGLINWDTTKPDGTLRKIMDNSKLTAMGWSPKIKLKEGLKMVFEEIKNNQFI